MQTPPKEIIWRKNRYEMLPNGKYLCKKDGSLIPEKVLELILAGKNADDYYVGEVCAYSLLKPFEKI